MRGTKLPPATLQKMERELARVGLLFQHDREHPSFTTIAAGEPIAGSWWSHPLAHPIYNSMGDFAEGVGKLTVKLVNGKLTFVHPRLWPALFAVALDRDRARLAGLSAGAAALRARVMRGGEVRIDRLRERDGLDARELSRDAAALEARLLVFTDSVHTESGAHAKVLRSFAELRRELAPDQPLPTPAEGRAALEAAAAVLTAGARRVRLPW